MFQAWRNAEDYYGASNFSGTSEFSCPTWFVILCTEKTVIHFFEFLFVSR